MKYKQDYSKCDIQFSYEWVFGSCTKPDDYRFIYWRIRPDEMTWWDRIFKNPWRQFRHAAGIGLNDIYSPRRFKEELSSIKTYEQALGYQNKQQRLIKEYYRKKQGVGEFWPDKLNS